MCGERDMHGKMTSLKIKNTGITLEGQEAKFGGKILPEMKRATIRSYLDDGWGVLFSGIGYAFVSPCDNWVHFFDVETDRIFIFSKYKARQVGLLKELK